MSDAEKEDRKAMEKKMDEMEEKLQVCNPQNSILYYFVYLSGNNGEHRGIWIGETKTLFYKISFLPTFSQATLTKLKEDNIRLREENAGLIKVMAKLSDNKK